MRARCKVCKELIKSGKLIIDEDGTPICRDCDIKRGGIKK